MNCKIPDCGKKAFTQTRLLCSMHDARLKRHGDPLIVLRKRVPLSPECGVPNCAKGPQTGQYCPMHATRIKRHGHTDRILADHGGYGTPEYRVWCAMIQRCYGKKHKRIAQYAGRGITVCDRWRHSFPNFLSDMGKRPSPDLSLDRIDNDKGYSPENCRWATRKQQQRNRSVNRLLTFQGETKPMAEWAEMLHVRPKLVANRLRDLGWSVERALTEPARKASL